MQKSTEDHCIHLIIIIFFTSDLIITRQFGVVVWLKRKRKWLGVILLCVRGSLRCCSRMAAAAAGLNKQGTVATMEPCIRHGRGANGNTVKVVIMSGNITAGPWLLWICYLFCFGEARPQVRAYLFEAKLAALALDVVVLAKSKFFKVMI